MVIGATFSGDLFAELDAINPELDAINRRCDVVKKRLTLEREIQQSFSQFFTNTYSYTKSLSMQIVIKAKFVVKIVFRFSDANFTVINIRKGYQSTYSQQ